MMIASEKPEVPLYSECKIMMESSAMSMTPSTPAKSDILPEFSPENLFLSAAEEMPTTASTVEMTFQRLDAIDDVTLPTVYPPFPAAFPPFPAHFPQHQPSFSNQSRSDFAKKLGPRQFWVVLSKRSPQPPQVVVTSQREAQSGMVTSQGGAQPGMVTSQKRKNAEKSVRQKPLILSHVRPKPCSLVDLDQGQPQKPQQRPSSEIKLEAKKKAAGGKGRTKAKSAPLHQCVICNQRLSSKASLKAHFQTSHKAVECPHCSKAMLQKHLNQHIKIEHAINLNLDDESSNKENNKNNENKMNKENKNVDGPEPEVTSSPSLLTSCDESLNEITSRAREDEVLSTAKDKASQDHFNSKACKDEVLPTVGDKPLRDNLNSRVCKDEVLPSPSSNQEEGLDDLFDRFVSNLARDFEREYYADMTIDSFENHWGSENDESLSRLTTPTKVVIATDKTPGDTAAEDDAEIKALLEAGNAEESGGFICKEDEEVGAFICKKQRLTPSAGIRLMNSPNGDDCLAALLT